MKQKFILGCTETQVIWYGYLPWLQFMPRQYTGLMPILFNSTIEAMDEAERIKTKIPCNNMRFAVTYMFIFENEPKYLYQRIIDPALPATPMQAKKIIDEANKAPLIQREEILLFAATKYDLLINPIGLN